MFEFSCRSRNIELAFRLVFLRISSDIFRFRKRAKPAYFGKESVTEDAKSRQWPKEKSGNPKSAVELN